MSFNEMMQQAIQIRTSTDAKLRVDFDSRPKFQQTSMFASLEVQQARSLPLRERLAQCIAMKLKGNDQMQNGRPDDACQTYEQALAMFWYLENRNEGWKTSGIKDEDIREVNFSPSSGVEALEEETRNVKVALLLNIARAYSAQGDYATSVKACDAALSIRPSGIAKALYLRGKALVAPASAGAFEVFEAIRDVSRAAELAPGDSIIRAFLAKLRAEKAKQNEVDRATFAGMFDRGSVCSPEVESKARPKRAPTHGNTERGVLGLTRRHGNGRNMHAGSEAADRKVEKPGLDENDDQTDGDGASGHSRGTAGSGGDGWGSGGGGGGDGGGRGGGGGALETRQQVEERVAFFKEMSRECEGEGREEEASRYRERALAIEEVLAEHDSQERERATTVDWRNPSEAMLEKATKEEYDLENPAVLSFLVKMQEEHRAKKGARAKIEMRRLDADQDRGGGGGGDGGCDGVSGTVHGGGDEEGDEIPPDDEDGQDGWTEEIWEGAIHCMSRTEVTSLLKMELGVDPEPVGASLRELRELAVYKLLGRRPFTGSPGQSAATNRKPASCQKESNLKRADWKLSAAITLMLFCFKTYQTGLLKWLVSGGGPPAGATRSAGTGPPDPWPSVDSRSQGQSNDNNFDNGTARTTRGRKRGGWDQRAAPWSSPPSSRGVGANAGKGGAKSSEVHAAPAPAPIDASSGGGGGASSTVDGTGSLAARALASAASGAWAVAPAAAPSEEEFAGGRSVCGSDGNLDDVCSAAAAAAAAGGGARGGWQGQTVGAEGQVDVDEFDFLASNSGVDQ